MTRMVSLLPLLKLMRLLPCRPLSRVKPLRLTGTGDPATGVVGWVCGGTIPAEVSSRFLQVSDSALPKTSLR